MNALLVIHLAQEHCFIIGLLAIVFIMINICSFSVKDKNKAMVKSDYYNKGMQLF